MPPSTDLKSLIDGSGVASGEQDVLEGGGGRYGSLFAQVTTAAVTCPLADAAEGREPT